MKEKIKKTIFLGLLICVFSVVSLTETALAKKGPGEKEFHGSPGKHRFHENKQKIMKEVLKEIGLSEEQQKQLETLHEKNKEKNKELRQNLHSKHIELKNELNKPVSDQVRINALIDELAKIHRSMIEQRVNGILEMKKVLTPEQFEMLNRKLEIKKEVQKEMKKFMKKSRHLKHKKQLQAKKCEDSLAI